jgi:alkylated DNA nucleotide flippase Atl1
VAGDASGRGGSVDRMAAVGGGAAPPRLADMTTERDWELVRRVVETLPEGTWTSYGDLAELIGTGPRQVGAFMRDDGGVPKAYRVLTAGGTVSEGFRWSDGRSGCDVPDLLREDGVTVSRKGRADRAQRMSVYDLKLLAAELDEDLEQSTSPDSDDGSFHANS